MTPTSNGWYAELAIGHEEKRAIDAFSNAVWSHVKKTDPDLAFVSPTSKPLTEDMRNGVEADDDALFHVTTRTIESVVNVKEEVQS